MALVAVALLAATFAVGDLVQRAQLRGWTQTTGVVTSTAGEVSVRHTAGDGPTDVTLPGWLGSGLDTGAKVETWVHPRDPSRVILTENTPLNALPIAGPIALLSAAATAWLLRRDRSRRHEVRLELDGSSIVAAPGGSRAGEWLAVSALPMAICVGSLGWLAANPEVEGNTQLGLASLTYLAAMFGVHRWMRAHVIESAAGQRGSDAAY